MSAHQIPPSLQKNCALWTICASLLVLALAPTVTALLETRQNATDSIPIKITNACSDTIWPAFATQDGTGPSTNGFELAGKSSKEVTVSHDWQGRVWGRTNCSFNANGTAASDGGSKACDTGDCNGVLNCVVTGDTPVTLFEIALKGGLNKTQSFYDISLVDGYNLPLGLTYIPNPSNPLDIPPNLTNPTCVATTPHAGPVTAPNTTYPTPYTSSSASSISRWCPWDLLLHPPPKPGNGVYPYPDDNIARPVFSPCLSSCAATGSSQDCCTGSHSSASTCSPGLYSHAAKAVCPDAYSYAFDDATSTFSIPSGGGWEVTFCPGGASTDILKVFGGVLGEIADTGEVTPDVWREAGNKTLVLDLEGGAGQVNPVPKGRERMGSLGALVVVLAWACLW